MFERQIPLFTLKGFKVGIDWSWLILALLVTWSLAAGLFPHYLDGLSTATYWWMGAAGAVGLFLSCAKSFRGALTAIYAKGRTARFW